MIEEDYDRTPMTLDEKVSNLHAKLNRIEGKIDWIMTIVISIAAGLLMFLIGF